MTKKNFCKQCGQKLTEVGKFWICPEHGQQIENEIPETLHIPLGKPVELAILATKNRASRCKLVSTGEKITLRGTADAVEGEIVTVKPSKVWQFKKTHYMSGKILSKRIDIPALQLAPLFLNDEWVWNPQDEYWGEPGDPISSYLKSIIDYGKRSSYEMEQILPFADPESITDPIIEAVDYRRDGDYNSAYGIMEELLTVDLRCLDAHAHLGAWNFNKESDFMLDIARRHYEVGVRIGELSFPPEFNGLLPWDRVDNRPFLRCLHGYGLCLWRQGKLEQAREVFKKLLWLNPGDNQGAEEILADIDAHKSWQELEVKF